MSFLRKPPQALESDNPGAIDKNRKNDSDSPAGERDSDETLMGRFQTTLDETAFDELVARYHRPALHIAQGLLPRSTAAEDVVQETFVRVVQRRHQYDPSRRFAAWFYTILRNACADCRRKEAVYLRVLDEAATQSDPKPPPAADPETVDALLSSLPEADRTLLILKIIHGLTFAEIARQVGCTEESAKKRAQRALQRLRQVHSCPP